MLVSGQIVTTGILCIIIHLAKLTNPGKIYSGDFIYIKSVYSMSHVTQSKSLNLFGFQFDSGNKEFGPNNKKNTFLVYKTL